jgi:hypothetical protein
MFPSSSVGGWGIGFLETVRRGVEDIERFSLIT